MAKSIKATKKAKARAVEATGKRKAANVRKPKAKQAVPKSGKTVKQSSKKAGKPAVNKSAEVDAFLAQLDHPLKPEIQALRQIIMGVNPNITEEIKWVAPTFSYKGYLVTFHVRATHHVHLIFHNAAILNDKSGLLLGDYPDRRMMYFTDMKEVKAKRAALEHIVQKWIDVMDKRDKA